MVCAHPPKGVGEFAVGSSYVYPFFARFLSANLTAIVFAFNTGGCFTDCVQPKRVFLAVVRPFGALWPDRIAAVTKELLVAAGIDMELFGAHTTRAGGLALLRALGLSAEKAAEIGSWANLPAFSLAYFRVGAPDVLSDALQRVTYVHTRPSTCCGAADSPVTPSSKHAEGGEGDGVAEQQGVGSTTPDPNVAPALPMHPPKSQAWSKVPTIKGWRSSPCFVNHLGKRRAPSPALLEERPRKEARSTSGRKCIQIRSDDLQ